MRYVRIRYRTTGGRPITTWAIANGGGRWGYRYERVRRDGSSFDVRELLLLAKTDIITETPARMNLSHGELEIERSKP